jgi:hypothetical protein
MQSLPEDGIPDDIVTVEDVTDDDGLTLDNGPEIIDNQNDAERIYEAVIFLISMKDGWISSRFYWASN